MSSIKDYYPWPKTPPLPIFKWNSWQEMELLDAPITYMAIKALSDVVLVYPFRIFLVNHEDPTNNTPIMSVPKDSPLHLNKGVTKELMLPASASAYQSPWPHTRLVVREGVPEIQVLTRQPATNTSIATDHIMAFKESI